MKLGELCNQYLKKGRHVYLEGHLRSHSYTDKDDGQRAVTEVVLEEMVMLDAKPQQTTSDKARGTATSLSHPLTASPLPALTCG
jgi:single-strand DNA-binding protein